MRLRNCEAAIVALREANEAISRNTSNIQSIISFMAAHREQTAQ